MSGVLCYNRGWLSTDILQALKQNCMQLGHAYVKQHAGLSVGVGQLDVAHHMHDAQGDAIKSRRGNLFVNKSLSTNISNKIVNDNVADIYMWLSA